MKLTKFKKKDKKERFYEIIQNAYGMSAIDISSLYIYKWKIAFKNSVKDHKSQNNKKKINHQIMSH